MKKLIAVLLLVSTVAFAQNTTLKLFTDTFTPYQLYSGSTMSSRTLSTTYSDTSRAFGTRGFAAIYVGIETTTNDSGRVLFAYQPSKNGVDFETEILFDSVSFVDSGYVAYKKLPDNAMGAHSVRLRAYGDANVAKYSANPSTLATFKVIRIPYNEQKVK